MSKLINLSPAAAVCFQLCDTFYHSPSIQSSILDEGYKHKISKIRLSKALNAKNDDYFSSDCAA